MNITNHKYPYRCPACKSTDIHVELPVWYGLNVNTDTGKVEGFEHLGYDLPGIDTDTQMFCAHCEYAGESKLFQTPDGDPAAKCPTCGNVHESCSQCGRPTRCPADEVGEQFSMCDECDKDLE